MSHRPSASTLVLIGLVLQAAVICLHRTADAALTVPFDALLWFPFVYVFFLGVVAGANGWGPGRGAALGLPFVFNAIALAYLIGPSLCPAWFDTIAFTAPWRSYWMEAFDWSLITLSQAVLGAMGVIAARLFGVLLRHAP